MVKQQRKNSKATAAHTMADQLKVATSSTAIETAAPKAVKPIKTPSMVFDEFLSKLDREDRTLFVNTDAEVCEGLGEMQHGIIRIGAALYKAKQSASSGEVFTRYIEDVAPRKYGKGISTLYRYMGQHITAAVEFPNPIARQYLFRLTDGSGILDSQAKGLTAAAKQALAENPVPPKTAPAAEVETWAVKYLRAVRNRGGKPDSGKDNFTESMERIGTAVIRLIRSEAKGSKGKAPDPEMVKFVWTRISAVLDKMALAVANPDNAATRPEVVAESVMATVAPRIIEGESKGEARKARATA